MDSGVDSEVVFNTGAHEDYPIGSKYVYHAIPRTFVPSNMGTVRLYGVVGTTSNNVKIVSDSLTNGEMSTST